jgi:hypothetical protein
MMCGLIEVICFRAEVPLVSVTITSYCGLSSSTSVSNTAGLSSTNKSAGAFTMTVPHLVSCRKANNSRGHVIREEHLYLLAKLGVTSVGLPGDVQLSTSDALCMVSSSGGFVSVSAWIQ